MIEVVIATILIYPHISLVWSVLSYIGFLIFILLLLGFIIYTLKPKPAKFPNLKVTSLQLDGKRSGLLKSAKKGKQNNSLASSTTSLFHDKLKLLHPNPLQLVLHSVIKEILIDQLSTTKFTKQILDVLLSTSKDGDQDELSLLDSKLGLFLKNVVDQFRSSKCQQLYELLLINGLECLKDHIKQYRKLRQEIEKESNVKQESIPTGHLDDFNDFSAATDDENKKWAQNLVKIHEMMILRLKAAKLLHPAVGFDAETEKGYIRNVTNQCFDLVKDIIPAPSKVVQIVFREWMVNRFAWPMIHKLSQPDTINSYILEKTNRKLIIQKAVKNFCSKLESDHSQFPPVFLISHYVPQKFSLSEKIRYLDVIGKYSRKATSCIDINAVKHEIFREIKRERDELEELKQNQYDYDAHKRYIKLLENVLRKLEKRLKSVSTDSRSPSQTVRRINSTVEQLKDSTTRPAELSLSVILEKYFKSSEEKGDMHSTSLFYFLDFVEKKGGKGLHLLRFWAATEKYKRLVWRIGNGLLNEPSTSFGDEKVEEFSPASHSRLQKEVSKIYDTFIVNQRLVDLSTQVLDAYKRYSNQGSTYYANDYLCVFKTQIRIYEELEKVFEDFQHSNSFFQWSSEMNKSRIMQEAPLMNERNPFLLADDDDWLSLFEESALMNSLEDALFNACGQVTGTKQTPAEQYTGPVSEYSLLNTVITLDDIVVDRENPLVDDQTSPVKEDEDEGGEVHAPGELITHTSKLAQINQSIERIMHQINCLNLLLRKVNLSKSDSDPVYIMQTHIIEESKDYLGQEIGDLSKQKAKLESQEQREALMPGQCFISIQELDDPEEEERPGKKITFYLITVEQRHLMTGWTVKRRYSDFDALHQKLKEEFAVVNDFDLPAKTLGLGVLSRSKAEMKAGRLKALERYLQRLIDNRDISKSEHVRNFLSSNFKPERKKFKPFEFGNEIIVSPNETLKRTQQKLAKTLSHFGKKREPLSKVMSFLDSKKKIVADVDDWEPERDKILTGKFTAALGVVPVEDQQSDTSDEYSSGEDEFISHSSNNPIILSLIQVLIQLFDFKEQNAWLRDNAALSVLHQFLGNKGSVENSISLLVKSSLSDETVIRYLKKYKDFVMKPSAPEPKKYSCSLRTDTKVKVLAVYSAPQARILGNDASYHGHVRFIELLQCEQMNKQFLFHLVDSSLSVIKNYIASTQ